jgi:drug/metabolite transporter (DMT)-like permease
MSQTNPKNDNPLWGIFYIITAVSILAVMDAFTKHVASLYSFSQILFFRSIFSFIPLYFYLKRSGQLNTLKTKRLGFHFYRGMISIFATYCFVYALANIPLASMYAIEFAAPIFITILSVYMLREYVGFTRWVAVIGGFLGVLFIVRPGSDTFQLASLIALFGSFFYALGAIQIRQLSTTESSGSIVFYFIALCTIVSAILLPFSWKTPNLFDLMCLISVGLCGGVGQILFTKAFSQQKLAVIAPFGYVGIIWAVFFGWLFWNEIPGMNEWLGGIIIIVSGLYITFQEQKAKKLANAIELANIENVPNDLDYDIDGSMRREN